MGKTYKESYNGSKQALEAIAYKAKKKIKHKPMEPYKRSK